MKHYIKVAKYVKYVKSEVILKIFLSLLVTGTYVLQAVCLSKGIAKVFAGDNFKTAAVYYMAVALLIVIRGLLVRYLEGYTKKIAGKLKGVLREKIIGKLLLLGPAYQADKRSGKMQSLVTDGVEYLEPYLINYIPQIFVVLFSVVPMWLYILWLNRAAGIILIIAILSAIIIPHMLMPFTSKSSIGYWREYAILNAQYVDTMQGMNTLKILAAEKYKGNELHKNSESFRQRQIVNTRNSLVSSAVIVFMMGMATSVTTGVAAYACSRGTLSYAGLLNIMFLVIECVRPVGEMNNAWHSSYLGLSVSKEFIEIVNEPVKISSPANVSKFPEKNGLPDIRFHDVDFSYTKERGKALKNVSFEIEEGRTVAFVGESGSGKSTIINLLMRFYDTEKGQISINGTDIRKMDTEELRKNIAVVFQNTYLFYGTVMENIRMARPDATEEEVFQAAKIAHAHEFIMELENGYDTLVGERGTTLSGGQRQRLSIARAILKNAPILIMDEATSSVDAATEEMIQETMNGIRKKYTTILIAHRLSTVQNADKIYVLNKGKIVEEGNHKELLEKKGFYYSLIEAQKKGEQL